MKLIFKPILFCLFLTIIFNCTFNDVFNGNNDTKDSFQDFKIDIVDQTFLSIVREKIKKPEGDIYYSDIYWIVELSTCSCCYNGTINDLSGLEYFTSLKKLSLNGFDFRNINAILKSKNLLELTIDSKLNDDFDADLKQKTVKKLRIYGDSYINFISCFENLEELCIDRYTKSEINDIKALTRLTKLKYLTLRHCRIVDISPLKNLSNLQELYLRGNYIADISALAKKPYF